MIAFFNWLSQISMCRQKDLHHKGLSFDELINWYKSLW